MYMFWCNVDNPKQDYFCHNAYTYLANDTSLILLQRTLSGKWSCKSDVWTSRLVVILYLMK